MPKIIGNSEPALEHKTSLSQLLLNAQTTPMQKIHTVTAANGILNTLICAEVSTAQMKLVVLSHLTLAAHVAKQKSKLAHLTLSPRTLSVMAVLGMQTRKTLVVFSTMLPSLQQLIAVSAVTLQR